MKLGKVIQHTIEIKPTSNQGFIAKIGCAMLAFSKTGDLIDALEAYLKDPEKFEEEYNNLYGVGEEREV